MQDLYPAQISYSDQDIKNNFNEKYYLRGKQYSFQGRVTNIVVEDNTVTALVKGSSSKPYKVDVTILEREGKVEFTGYCTCLIRFKCKHVVAVLLDKLNMKVLDITANKSVIRVSEDTEITKSNLDSDVKDWLEDLDGKKEEDNDTSKSKKFIAYFVDREDEDLIVFPMSVSVLKSGRFGVNKQRCSLYNIQAYNRVNYVTSDDMKIFKLLVTFTNTNIDETGYSLPSGEEGELILKLLIATKRCYLHLENICDNYLVIGEKRSASIGWRVQSNGNQVTYVKVEGIKSSMVFVLQRFYYICPQLKAIGMLDINMPNEKAKLLLEAPPIKPEQVSVIAKKLENIAPDTLPSEISICRLSAEPIPHIKLCATQIVPIIREDWYGRHMGSPVSIATIALSFKYENKSVEYHDSQKDIRFLKNGELIIINRNKNAEKKIREVLRSFGLTISLKNVLNFYDIKTTQRLRFTIGEARKKFHKSKAIEPQWKKFMEQHIPILKERGWNITMDKDFPYNIVEPDDEWYAKVEESSGIDWFEVELGVTIDGKKCNLIPILLDLLKQNNDIFAIINKLPKNKPLLVPLEDGRRIALQPDRAKTLLTTLQHIFSFQKNIDEHGKLKMQKLEASLLAEIEAASKSLKIRWFGGEKIRELGKNLKSFTSIADVTPPAMFHGELRHYQQEGLNWLQFLKEYELAGILADDMGLGKTVQLLAHIAKERSTQKLEFPFLVIAPTSLMVNWKIEANKFVPDLKVLTLHGAKRKMYFKNINDYDLVLTTYPLLIRDKDVLLENEYHTIILDEAQTIKNFKAKMTQVVNQLKAKYRLCMTGTPIENHLGELWSIFNFLLPNYLGNYKQFCSLFRTPIEKNGDTRRNEVLAKRIKPFIVRRTKQEVATELPKKTEMLRMVELEGEQRDLYETIRASMHEKLQREIAARGVEKTHIIVLDALLKLRQVCCDPALIKSSEKIIQSAKREELMRMLKEMMEEGRKILLFSQFTSMLALIEKALTKEKISYVKLTGQTVDRETPIRRFQKEDKIKLFLISLKAGGVGLNLTAADTVIHYDPWWNPAVENQATDRAYRIGQDKPVFVYKLITSGTVEEKIIEMQNKKRKLMDGLFDPTTKVSTKLTAEDIQLLLEPLI